ncbi:hypothetical protein TKK_0009498 [Trichogramma kaykai]
MEFNINNTEIKVDLKGVIVLPSRPLSEKREWFLRQPIRTFGSWSGVMSAIENSGSSGPIIKTAPILYGDFIVLVAIVHSLVMREHFYNQLQHIQSFIRRNTVATRVVGLINVLIECARPGFADALRGIKRMYEEGVIDIVNQVINDYKEQLKEQLMLI